MEWQSIQLLSVHRRPATRRADTKKNGPHFLVGWFPFLCHCHHTLPWTNNRPYSLGFLLLVCLPAWISSPSFDSTILIKCTPPSVYYYCFRYKRYRFLGLSFFCSFTSLLHRDGGAWMTDRCLVYQYNFHRASSLHGKKKIWVLWRIRYQIPTPHTAKQNGEQWRPCWTFLLKWEHAVLEGYLLWPHISPRTFLLLLFWLSVTKRRTPLKMMFGSFRRNIKFAVELQKESQGSTSVWWFPGFSILYLAIFGMTLCLSVPSHLRTRSRRISLRIDCFLLR